MAERQSLRAAAKVIEEKLTAARTELVVATLAFETARQKANELEAQVVALEYAYEAVKPKGRKSAKKVNS